ncbi:MAG TPA: cupin domain-containing protein [Vicinamibacterales bacterium]|nr:cupin domain-containing protein [Vicinamibacterales bacterium]
MIVRGDEAPTEPAEPGVTRQVLGHDAELMMVRVTFTKGAVGHLHSHPQRQVTYVERGRFRFMLNGGETEMVAGDCWFVPPDAPHGVIALEGGALIDVFTPARTEFLPGRAS